MLLKFTKRAVIHSQSLVKLERRNWFIWLNMIEFNVLQKKYYKDNIWLHLRITKVTCVMFKYIFKK